VRLRLITAVSLAATLLVLGGLTALAAPGLLSHRSAAIAQYGPPPPPPVAEDAARGHGAITTEAPPSAEAPPLAPNTNPEAVPAPTPVYHVEAEREPSAPRAEVQPERQAVVAASSGLPFTGYVALGVLGVALALLAAGLGLRALTSGRSDHT
jgi:hypothetical protein